MDMVLRLRKWLYKRETLTLFFHWCRRRLRLSLKRLLKRAFRVRKLGKEAAEVAGYGFFETAVRAYTTIPLRKNCKENSSTL
jgi:hypothetical protein